MITAVTSHELSRRLAYKCIIVYSSLSRHLLHMNQFRAQLEVSSIYLEARDSRKKKKSETENPSGSKRGKVELEMMRGKQKTGLTDNKYEIKKKNDKDTITKITATMGELADQEKEKHPTV